MQELSADCYMSRDKKTNCQGPVLGMSLICFLLSLSLVQYVVSCPAARAPLAWRQDVWQASDRGSCRSLVASACESRSCSLPFSHANSCGKWARGLGGGVSQMHKSKKGDILHSERRLCRAKWKLSESLSGCMKKGKFCVMRDLKEMGWWERSDSAMISFRMLISFRAWWDNLLEAATKMGWRNQWVTKKAVLWNTPWSKLTW